MNRLKSLVLLLVLAAATAIAQETPPQPSLSSEALAHLKARAEAGDAKAQRRLARAYEQGEGVPQNDALAAQWCRKAAEQGDADAQNSLGVMYRLGRGVEKSKDEAVSWYRRAAKQGHADAMFNLGAAYYNGDGVQEDYQLAHAWFALAERAGSAAGREAAARSRAELHAETLAGAEAQLAYLLERGEEVPPDRPAALAIYRRLAEAGNNFVALRLSAMYFNGVGVERDPLQAFRWYEMAAEHNYPPAMQNLAVMYSEGAGVPRDYVAAYMWFLGASSRGLANAVKAIELIKPKMTPKEIRDAEKRAVKRWPSLAKGRRGR